MHDIELVQDMSTVNDGVDGVKFKNAIIIKTHSDGHNGGRTYYLQADNSEDCFDLVYLLKNLASEAEIRVKAKTKFTRIRFKARNIFLSWQFQLSSALLILAVIPLCVGVFFPAAAHHRSSATSRTSRPASSTPSSRAC